MRAVSDVKYEQYEDFARTRLSPNFLMRDFLFSTQAAAARLSNFPSDDPALVLAAGRALCERLLEPLLERFGRFAITFGYQSREVLERKWSAEKRAARRFMSAPHQWDRGEPFPGQIYARVDILPFCVEDGSVSKQEFGRWMMFNLDVDLLMQWRKSNVCCITIGPKPRRVWLEWVPPGEGDGRSNRIECMGIKFWQDIYPTLPDSERPKFHPSATGGSMRFGAHAVSKSELGGWRRAWPGCGDGAVLGGGLTE